jgi:hypothetical protein
MIPGVEGQPAEKHQAVVLDGIRQLLSRRVEGGVEFVQERRLRKVAEPVVWQVQVEKEDVFRSLAV